MAENKKSFVAYCDWENQLNLLSDDEAGKLFRHLLAFVNDKNPEFSSEERILKMAFEPIKQQLKRDLEKYEEVKKKRSEAGRSGGLKSGISRSKTEQKEPNEANASFAKKNEANEAVNVNGNVNVNDILLEKESKEEKLIKENSPKVFPETESLNFEMSSPPKKVAAKKGSTEKFKAPSVQQVQDYCNERENGISAYGFVNFYQSKGWKVGNQPMKDWKAAVRTWETKNQENGKSVNNNTNTGFSGKAGGAGGSAPVSGKITGRSLLAKEYDKHTSKNGNSGDITIDAKIIK